MLTRERRRPLHQKLQPPSPREEVAGFKSEQWPLSNRNRGRLQVGMVAGLKSEKAAAFGWNLHVKWAVIHGRLDALSRRHDTKQRAANGILKRRSARRLEPFTMPLPAAQQDRLERIQPRR